jgi:hypothetical protein
MQQELEIFLPHIRSWKFPLAHEHINWNFTSTTYILELENPPSLTSTPGAGILDPLLILPPSVMYGAGNSPSTHKRSRKFPSLTLKRSWKFSLLHSYK